MSGPRVFSIQPGAPFLPTLADELLSGRLVPGFRFDGDPLALADATIFVPTRRAARALRAEFTAALGKCGVGGSTAILPVIRPLGDFDEDEAAFEENDADPETLDLAPPIGATDRLLLLAPLVRAWKRRLPAHVAALFEEEIVVPASTADAIWLARDLARLIDEIETEGSDWTRLSGLVDGNLAGWWQVTLDFLKIVTENWPKLLEERGRSDPSAHRNATIRLEAERLRRNPPSGPVVAAGSTGSIPATADLLAAIAALPNGAVVLPGLDIGMDQPTLASLTTPDMRPAVLGHPQYGLVKLLGRLGILPRDVEELGVSNEALGLRRTLLGEAMRPAETTELWRQTRRNFADDAVRQAFAEVTLIEAANERDEAAAIAVALRLAVEENGHRAALVTGDRALARRVASELKRFGIAADDSGGTPLAGTPPATLLRLLLETAFRPGDPVAILSLLKHPLLTADLDRALVRRAERTIELVTLRGGTGRPDVASLDALFESRLTKLDKATRPPFWLQRISSARRDEARALLGRLAAAVVPLAALRDEKAVEFSHMIRASVTALEALGRTQDGALAELYKGDAGEKLAGLLRELVAASESFPLDPGEWPDVMEALVAPVTVKPAHGADHTVAIWGALEARLQSVDTLVVGGLNEGVWPRKPQGDRFLSRLMRTGIDLEPPERRIGLAAHDFQIAAGSPRLVLTRAARAGDAPAAPSRWLQRLLTFLGEYQAAAMRGRGAQVLSWSRALDESERVDFAPRPEPKPPLALRPRRFSVTEIETLRRDPYAVYARRILGLMPVEPLVRDPGAAERGTLFHEILHRFSKAVEDPRDDGALAALVEAGRTCFVEAELPDDVAAVWWPRFEKLAGNILAWERRRADAVSRRFAEAHADPTAIGSTGATLSGYADRIDLLAGGMADILDYKTGTSPSKAQAHTLLAPQLALEGALLRRGAFPELGPREPADLAFVRLKANGEVEPESILEYRKQPRGAEDLSEDAWSRLERLLEHYGDPQTGYLSRALPMREGETDGDYDHLARTAEWLAGGDGPEGGEGET